ncbi:MAG: deoxycytidylate deaminase [Clostridium fessum]
MERRDKVNYYLDLAEMVSQRSTCLRKHYGAVIVNNDEVISTGYVGAPRGRKNCSDIGRCIREELHVPRGERYELCRSVHAEANALDQCLQRAHDRRVAVSDRCRCENRRVCGKIELLFDVQAHGNQCRN